MATTDTRSGFRLPWSSDRSHDADSAGNGTEPVAEAAEQSTDAIAPPATTDNDPLEPTVQQESVDASDTPSQPDVQEPEMIDMEPAPPPAPVTPKKPTKLMTELSAAIRATAETARDQALTQVDADVAAVVEQIRAGSKEGEDLLRVRSDEDVAQIKEWSRAEIARIKEETESRISARKLSLDGELAAHAAAIEQRVGEVEEAAAAFRADIASYTERLSGEDDPARLATMAESMPEAPALDALADLGDLKLDLAAVTAPDADEPEAVLETTGWETEAEASDQPSAGADAAGDEVAETAATDDPVADEAAVDGFASSLSPWREADSAWGSGAAQAAEPPAAVEPEELDDDGSGAYTANDEVAGWDGDSPLAGASMGATGDPADRGEIMAALEAAAEAVVAAESAAESADQAEAAADLAETAAGLIKGRPEPEETLDPEAAAAMSARVDAGGFEESYTGRLASLLPSHAEGLADGEPRTTQVIVSGLVSVASIASFKRHLGRLAGVQAVAVASGPDGEFVFNVTHRPDVSFRDALPTMPGFAARVTSTDDSSVHVTARDPESEA